MTGLELYEKVKNGWNPTVRFTDSVGDSNSQYEEGMMGKVISARFDTHDIIIFTIAEDRFAEFNKKQEKPVWYENQFSENCTTKSMLGGRKACDVVYEDVDMELGNFEIVKDESLILYDEYCKDNPKMSYLSWLENRIIQLESKG